MSFESISPKFKLMILNNKGNFVIERNTKVRTNPASEILENQSLLVVEKETTQERLDRLPTDQNHPNQPPFLYSIDRLFSRFFDRRKKFSFFLFFGIFSGSVWNV